MADNWDILTTDDTWTEEAEKLLKEAKRAAAKMKNLLEVYAPSLYDEQILHANQNKWLKRVETSYEAFVDIAIDLQLEVPDAAKVSVTAKEDQIKEMMVAYVRSYNAKILSSNTESTASASAEAKRRAMIEVKLAHEKINSDAKYLATELSKYEDWNVAESHMIEVAMGKIPDWKKRFQKIQSLLFEMRKLTLTHNLATELTPESESVVGELQSLLDACVVAIENQDAERCLYSMNQARGEVVSYPTFSGGDEDFTRFEREFRDALKSNLVPKDSLVKKLRENLYGTPRDIIPKTLHDLEKALKILRDMYGDSSRLVDVFKKKLFAMGPLPAESKDPSKASVKVQWLIQLEVLLKELLELAKLNQDNNCEVNNNTTLRDLKKLFPYEIHKKLNDFNGTAAEKLLNVLQYIGKLRDRSQAVLKDLDGHAHAHGGRRAAVADHCERDDCYELYCIQEGIEYVPCECATCSNLIR